MDCIFCKIINGEIPSKKIYEDDQVIVFMDINPSNNGHSLIVPKKHVITIYDVDDNLHSHILDIECKMYNLFKEKLNATGLTIINNNDYGQEVKHLHIHLIPRYENDYLRVYAKEDFIEKDIDKIFNKLK